jgi:hypothetical protein
MESDGADEKQKMLDANRQYSKFRLGPGFV